MTNGDGSALNDYDGGSPSVYQAMVEDLDAAVSKVLHSLEASGQRNTTLVYFASDNGGERFSSMGPFTGGKDTLYEGGIRVPTLLSWPGTLPPRRVSAEPVITMDWTATFLELAGATPRADFPLDGSSLVGYLFAGEHRKPVDLFWWMADQAALRRGRLKYLRTEDDGEALFDLEADDQEQTDLSGVQPDVLSALRTAWEQVNAELLPYP